MGYYSEVSILCGRNVAKKLVELPTLFGARIKIRQDKQFRFYWKSVKWYEESDDEVKAVMKVVNDFIDNHSGDVDKYKDDFVSFIRIGDADDDTYFNCNYQELNSQWVKRSIDAWNDDEDEVHHDGIEFLPQNYIKRLFDEGEV